MVHTTGKKPVENVSRWAVLCPGPSLADVSDGDVIAPPENRIAVNLAVSCGLEFRYFAFLDFNTYIRYRNHIEKREQVELMFAQKVWNEIECFKQKSVHRDIIAQFESRKHHMWTRLMMRMATRQFRSYIVRIRSTHFAVVYAMMLGGREVTMYGCDMKGSDWFGHERAWISDEELIGRWEEERKELDRIIHAARRRGIKIKFNRKTRPQLLTE